MTAHDGSEMLIKHGGAVTFALDIGSPACSDGGDNDADTFADHADDPECDAAADASERLDGIQAYAASSLPLTVAADGTITVDPTQLSIQQREFCMIGAESALWCFGLTVKGAGSTQTGTISSEGVTIPWSVVVEVDAVTGVTGLGADCQIGPITTTLASNTYDEVTGQTTLTSSDATLPAVTGCGSDWSNLIDLYLGLPALGDATLEAMILDANGNPISIE
jgi:hypothetical protein